MGRINCFRWPVIAAIIVAGLILLSVVACIVRCACCGMSCCCSCFACLKCCGNCCGCCDDPKGRKHKHLDDEYATPFAPAFAPQTGYKPPVPMMAGGIGASTSPQFAHFETGPSGFAVEPKKVNDDALPPMPSWEQAQKKRIAQEQADIVEMGELDPTTGQKVPLMTGAGSTSRTGSPGHSPTGEEQYGDRPDMHSQNTSYMGAAAVGGAAMGMGAMHNDPYGNGRGNTMDNRGGYGNGRGGYPPGPGRGYDNQYDDQSSYNGSNSNFTALPAGTYPPRGPPQRQYSGSDARSNAPSSRPYTNDRQYSDAPSSQYNNRPYPAGPYGNDSSQDRVANPPLNNNSGFDFNGGNARPAPPPQQQSYGSSYQGGNYASSVAPSMPPSYRTNSPTQDASYPGYQPYSPPRQQGGRGEPPNMRMPGPRRGGQGYDRY